MISIDSYFPFLYQVYFEIVNEIPLTIIYQNSIKEV